MRVSAAKVYLSEKDILSIIEQFVHVEGLQIKAIKINDLITVKGEYKKGVIIPFTAKIGIGIVVNNSVNVMIFGVKVSKIGILDSIKKLAMKAFLKDLDSIGLHVQGDTLNISMNKLSKIIPYVYFNLKNIEVQDGFIEAKVENIIYTEDKETISIKHESVEKTKKVVSDGYTKIRHKVMDKVPDKHNNLVKYAMVLPDMVALLYRLFLDKRVSGKTKVLVGGILTYLASPIDLLPDFIPFIGKIDDVAIAFYGLNVVINDIPEYIILENWQGEENIITIVQEGVKYISKIAGSDNIVKLVTFIKSLSVKAKKEEKKDEEDSNIH